MPKWISATQPGTTIERSVGTCWIPVRSIMRLQYSKAQRTAWGPFPSSRSSRLRSRDSLRHVRSRASCTSEGSLTPNSRICAIHIDRTPAAPISFEYAHEPEMGNRRSEHSPSVRQLLALLVTGPGLGVLDVSGTTRSGAMPNSTPAYAPPGAEEIRFRTGGPRDRA